VGRGWGRRGKSGLMLGNEWVGGMEWDGDGCEMVLRVVDDG